MRQIKEYKRIENLIICVKNGPSFEFCETLKYAETLFVDMKALFCAYNVFRE